MATFRKSRADSDRPVKFGGAVTDEHKFTGVLNVTGGSTVLHLSSDANSNILFASGSGRIGLSTSTPNYTLDINGNLGVSGSVYFAADTYHSGNMGIGVNDPDQKLEVAGIVHISAESATPSAPSDGDGGLLYAKSNGKVYWRSNEISEVDLTQGGGGGATVAGSDTQFQYNNDGNFGGAANMVYDSGTGYVGIGVAAGSATHRLTLPNTDNAGGQVKANSFVSYSSRRYKKDIETLANPLEIISSLRGVRFKWKESSGPDIGFIAEEVGEILPEVVTWEENGTDAQSMDYSKITSVLVEAVKMQQRIIDDLYAEVSSLNERIKTI